MPKDGQRTDGCLHERCLLDSEGTGSTSRDEVMTTAAIRQNMATVEWTQLITLSMRWRATYFFVAVAFDTYTPLVMVLARVGLAALALSFLLLVLRIRRPMSVSLWCEFIIMALLNNFVSVFTDDLGTNSY